MAKFSCRRIPAPTQNSTFKTQHSGLSGLGLSQEATTTDCWSEGSVYASSNATTEKAQVNAGGLIGHMVNATATAFSSQWLAV
jgi:hypothetical protein